MSEKRCIVEFIPDTKLGWVIKPVDGCEEVFKQISENQGPHAQKYLDVRKVEIPKEVVEQPQSRSEE